jgi:hypothetical protein
VKEGGFGLALACADPTSPIPGSLAVRAAARVLHHTNQSPELLARQVGLFDVRPERRRRPDQSETLEEPPNGGAFVRLAHRVNSLVASASYPVKPAIFAPRLPGSPLGRASANPSS